MLFVGAPQAAYHPGICLLLGMVVIGVQRGRRQHVGGARDGQLDALEDCVEQVPVVVVVGRRGEVALGGSGEVAGGLRCVWARHGVLARVVEGGGGRA